MAFIVKDGVLLSYMEQNEKEKMVKIPDGVTVIVKGAFQSQVDMTR